jgi:hypothetical protein
MQSKLNRDWPSRDKIIGITADWKKDDIIHFDWLTISQLDRLVEGNFIDIGDRQNSAASVGEIRDFMHKYPQTFAMGYAVNPSRGDYRVSLEGIYIPKSSATAAARTDAIALCKDADDVDVDSDIGCWWD